MSVGVMPGRGGHTPALGVAFGHAAGVSPGPRRGCAGCVRWTHVSGRHFIRVTGLPGRWCCVPWGKPLVLPRRGVLVACGVVGFPGRAEVAHLAGQGMTNKEIAAELFITPKAVGYHLGNIYAKFGVTGRHQLRRLLRDSRRPAPA